MRVLLTLLLCLQFSSLHSISSAKIRKINTNDAIDSISLFDNEDSTNRILSNFVYVNPNDTYVASDYVKFGNELFNTVLYNKSLPYDYVGIQVAALLFVLAVISFFLLNCGLLCRCCFECCNCYMDVVESTGNTYRKCNLISFIILLIFMVIVDQVVFLGNTKVDTAVDTIYDQLSFLDDSLGNVLTSATSLTSQGAKLTTNVAYAKTGTNKCTLNDTLASLTTTVSTYNTLVGEITTTVEPRLSNIANAQDYLYLYGTFYRNIGLYVTWGLGIAIFFFFLVSHCCKSELGIKITIFCAQFVFVLYVLLGVAWGVAVAQIGHMCVDNPSYFLLSKLSEGTLRTFFVYYSSCQGTCDLSTLIDGIESARSSSSYYVEYALNSTCSGNSNLLTMRTSLATIKTTMESVQTTMKCSNFQSSWFKSVNEGVCTDLFDGLYFIFWSQLVTSFLLFWLIVAASITYQYYNVQVKPFEDLDNEENEDVVIRDDLDVEDSRNHEQIKHHHNRLSDLDDDTDRKKEHHRRKSHDSEKSMREHHRRKSHDSERDLRNHSLSHSHKDGEKHKRRSFDVEDDDGNDHKHHKHKRRGSRDHNEEEENHHHKKDRHKHHDDDDEEAGDTRKKPHGRRGSRDRSYDPNDHMEI
eukprot:gene12210-16358_t